MHASLEDINFLKDGMVDIGQRMVSRTDLDGLRVASVASVDAIRDIGKAQGVIQTSLKQGEAKTKEALRQSQKAEAKTKEALRQSQEAEAKTKDALRQSQTLHAEDKEKINRQTYMLSELNKQLNELKSEATKLKLGNTQLKTALEGMKNIQALQEDISSIKNLLKSRFNSI